MDFDMCWASATRRVEVITSTSAAEEAISSILRGFSSEVVHHVGFDTEWGSSGEVAVVQLANETSCLLCLLPEVCLNDCPSFLALLGDPQLLKMGVAVALDAELLKNQFKIEMKGCVDLSRLAMREGEVRPGAQPMGLAALTQLLLGIELSKDMAIRRSNWAERPLSRAQLEYAARDALAGHDCGLALARKHKPPGMKLWDWCQDLVDKGKDAKTGKLKKTNGGNGDCAPCMNPELKGVSKATLDCEAYSCVNKFGLRPVYGSDGQQLLHMKDRTVEGLLRRGMASTCREGEMDIIRLHFTPTDHYAYAGLDAAERNACVGCGSYGVARYYIIPRVFFCHLPQKCKSYNCHDVVMLCPRCRAIAEPAQLALTQELLASHGALRAGSLYANENTLTPTQIAAKKAAVTLRRAQKAAQAIPAAKLTALHEAVAAGLGMPLTDGSVGDTHLALAEMLGAGRLPSERVVESAARSPESLRRFLRLWRESFVEVLKPKYLAEGWSLDTGLDGRFVPSVASSLEWPGDWRCHSCGVHCFGRSDWCRCCNEPRPTATGGSPAST
ncbi:Exonuclease 3'-5' domain-containing protein 2 (3'-5' exoribonuclease EXD2) (Exonuclease 3'-5' domain-like-containing protein 2) [Durusdinium trenchii]|uniref:3'-5' exonuclease n=1 Tax=Durusdinium trenchii TaxID=1381693 RepID=A0ABP0IJ48_9DINO